MDTFVVRIWTPAEDGGDSDGGELHGVVKRVATGDEAAFRGDAELLAFIRNAIVVQEERPRS